MQSDRIPNETKAGRQHELEQLQHLQQRRRRASDAQKPICFPFALRTELPPPAAAPQALGGLLSTRGFSDDTHDDFKAKANADVSDVAASIQADIDKNNVMVYMKGVPAAPMCGFSNTVCRVLDAYGACPVLSSHPPPPSSAFAAFPRITCSGYLCVLQVTIARKTLCDGIATTQHRCYHAT